MGSWVHDTVGKIKQKLKALKWISCMILLISVAYLLACVTGRALKSRSRSSSSKQAEIMSFCPTSFDDGYLLGSFTVPPSDLTGYVSCFDSPDSPFFTTRLLRVREVGS